MNSLYKIYLRYQALKRAFKSTKLYLRYAQFKEELEDQKLNRICVGQDRMGNKFYQYYSYYGLPTKREIRFKDDRERIVNDLAYYDWLYKRIEQPPTEEQVEQFYKEEQLRFQRAREWDEQQEKMMLAFYEQRKIREEQYKKAYLEQKNFNQNSEVFAEITNNSELKQESQNEQWQPKSKR
ncbi:unnamed protein product [Paramecium octaurelia]|uniref:Uncharacterized protein n=1 Tax=Paramecium octaurelia TaxID=43137 RepID=A0A8S1VR72_PAROT|nr:unnamed protein product [Paramecium octaurelia]